MPYGNPQAGEIWEHNSIPSTEAWGSVLVESIDRSRKGEYEDYIVYYLDEDWTLRGAKPLREFVNNHFYIRRGDPVPDIRKIMDILESGAYNMRENF